MEFKISQKIFEDFPGLYIGVVVARGVDNRGEDFEIEKLLRLAEENLRKELESIEIPQHPYIKPWREAYKKFGAKGYRSSNEALARIVLKGIRIRHINKLVDIYNLICLKYILPVGGEDLDKIKGDLILGYAKGDENFVPLGEEENQPPKLGEVVYKDDLGVLCRRWNWREGERTKFSEESKNAILVIEGLPPIEKEIVKRATEELVQLIQKFCGGEMKIFFLEKQNPEIDL